MPRLLNSGLLTSGPAPFRSRSPKGTLTFQQLQGQKTVLSTCEKFHPRNQSAAPRKPRPSRSIPSRAGPWTRGPGGASCAPPAPQDRPRRATHPAPRFQTKCHRTPGREEPPTTDPGRDPGPGGSVGGDAECGGCGGRRGGESRSIPPQPAPLPRSLPAGSARRPQPPLRKTPGTARSRGGGDPGHPSRWARPSAPGPPHVPTSAAGPRCSVPGQVGAGLPGLSAGARLTPSRERAGAGHRLLLGLEARVANRILSRAPDVT